MMSMETRRLTSSPQYLVSKRRIATKVQFLAIPPQGQGPTEAKYNTG